ncbi:hypothetical protein [Novosphingobium sp. AP12]|uniref:hypothetical protein n=1 Tax=Novosphingobium sp. AP12 TaxID=1144305 RepID=UPI000271E2E3|nr:hypothetical protein [Novosphingobium sp. AP12]EJL21924.1 hypothetical protein PMI02_04909 [Novosphingobium sp. AP12]
MQKDVALLAANHTLGMRSVYLAILASRGDETESLEAQLEDIWRYADETWEIWKRRGEVKLK